MLHAVGLLQSLRSIPLLPMTRRKKCQFGYSEILLQGKVHLRAWACFLFLLSSFSFFLYSISPRLALHSIPPPSYCLVFLLSLCSYLLPLYFNFNFVLFFLLLFFCSLYISLSLVSALWGSFGSERRFGARLWQTFTLIKRMVGSTTGAAWGYFSS